jgi:hypothetical protein
MWPWGHAALAYLVYRLVARDAVSRFGARDLTALVVGAALPDLVDKPLGWYLNLFPSGRALAHSVFVALALTLLVRHLTADARPEIRLAAVAFVTGYWAHLLGDLFEALVAPDGPVLFFLYPVYVPPPATGAGVGYYLTDLVAGFRAFLTTGELAPGTAVALVELCVVAAAVARWVADGRPGLPALDGHKPGD